MTEKWQIYFWFMGAFSKLPSSEEISLLADSKVIRTWIEHISLMWGQVLKFRICAYDYPVFAQNRQICKNSVPAKVMTSGRYRYKSILYCKTRSHAWCLKCTWDQANFSSKCSIPAAWWSVFAHFTLLTSFLTIPPRRNQNEPLSFCEGAGVVRPSGLYPWP